MVDVGHPMSPGWQRSAARRWTIGGAAGALLLTMACAAKTPTATAPAVPPVPVAPPLTWQQKIGWIVRLEDQRLVRDPAPPPPAVLRAASATSPALVALPAPSDLIALLADPEPQVRARAALALGRVGLPEAIAPLAALLSDGDVPVRQTSAFALGLIGEAAARPALLTALSDASPVVQGRAAEALALVGNKADAAPIAAMVRVHVQAGVLNGIQPDDLGYPLAPPVEAVRLGLYALTRLTSYDALASVVLSADGQTVSRWWPVAYALQRVADVRAMPALVRLLETPGRYTAAFAAKGLSRSPSPEAVTALRRIVEERRADPAVVVQAMRSLAAAGAGDALPALLRTLRDPTAAPIIRTEATAAFAALAGRPQAEMLLDMLTDPSVDNRVAATGAVARVDPESFLSALSSLDPDPEWRVRSAQAEASGKLPGGAGVPRLLAMMSDSDARVLPVVLAGLAAANAPDAAKLATGQLTARDAVVRSAAANALAELKAVSAVPALVNAYRAAREETTYVARAAMLSALDRLDAEAARPVLTEALTDRDWAVRVRAADLLRQRGVVAPANRMRPATPGKPVDDPGWQRIVAPPFTPLAYIETSKGTIEVELAITDAPLTTENFIGLARQGFFENLRIHRVVPDFVVQGGDPRGDGEGGPGFTIRDEINERPYLRGTVGMALDWEDTGGSQFFITHSPQPHLDARYTVFGRVINGMNVVDSLTQADVIERVRIWDGVNAR